MNINDAIKIMKDEVTDVYAQAYLNALPIVIEDDGMRGMCIQLKYVLENVKSWNGSNAAEVKKFVKSWIKAKETINAKS
jgi:hypothetical protein